MEKERKKKERKKRNKKKRKTELERYCERIRHCAQWPNHVLRTTIVSNMWSATCSPPFINLSSGARSVHPSYRVTLLTSSSMGSGPIRPILVWWRNVCRRFSHRGLPKSWPIDDGRVNSPVKRSVHVSRRICSNATHLRRTYARVIRGVPCELYEGSQNQHPSCDLFLIRLCQTPLTFFLVKFLCWSYDLIFF
jgi:hypothetical protein